METISTSTSRIRLSENSDVSGDFDTLVCIDGSYVIYHTLYSAVKKWTDESPMSEIIENVDVESPDFEQVDLTTYEDFLDILKGRLIETFNRITNMVKEYNDVNNSTTYGSMFFVLDPEHGMKSRSWRYLIYPEYKGQRRDDKRKKAFHVDLIFRKAVEMIREDGIFEKRFNMRVFSADGVEADDMIATLFMDEGTKGFNKYLIASDKDYLQLSGVTQMTLEGKQVEIEQPYPELITITPDTYLLAKIIVGDDSDNITQVFNRVGYKTAIKKYVSKPEFLNESLENDAIAMAKFRRNERLIDFKRMPKKIRDIAKKAISL